MLEEYALVPDIFQTEAYTAEVLADAYLPFLKEPLFQEALVRDLCDGGWSLHCLGKAETMHRLGKEILRKLQTGNRLCVAARCTPAQPEQAADWCSEALSSHAVKPLSGIVTTHHTKLSYPQNEVASIEKLAGTAWWQSRSPSKTLGRKTADYLAVLDRVLRQANSLMFIDPNLDPSQRNYREFVQLLHAMAGRTPRPRIELHRSFCKGDGPARTFPSQAEWQVSFHQLGQQLSAVGLSAEVFFWEDFHERYLITDIVGVSVPAGFDITVGQSDWSTWGRLGRADRDKIQLLFDPAARTASLKARFRIGAVS